MHATLVQTLLAAFCAILAHLSQMGGGGMIAAHHSMLQKSAGGFIIPSAYIDFNITGVTRKSRYFNSGVVPTANTKVEIMLVRNDAPAKDIGFQMGCRTGWVNGAMQLNVNPRNQRFWFAWNTQTDNPDVTEYDNPPQYAIAAFNPGGLVSVVGVNPDVVYTYDFNQNFYSSRSNAFYIGDSNENGTAKGRTDSQGSGRIAWVKFYESDVLTHNFVAAQSGGSPVFYDEVTGNTLQSEGNATASSIRYVEI